MGTKSLTGKTVLVVEDDQESREAWAAVLGQHGYTVVTAVNGREAQDRLGGEPTPDLVLLDMMMPGFDGWRFLLQRKRTPAFASIPVVITTALPVASPEWASSLGADGFLQKPFETEELLAEVRRWC